MRQTGTGRCDNLRQATLEAVVLSILVNLTGCFSVMSLKRPLKRAEVIIAELVRYGRRRETLHSQQPFRFGHPDATDVLGRRIAQHAFEMPGECFFGVP